MYFGWAGAVMEGSVIGRCLQTVEVFLSLCGEIRFIDVIIASLSLCEKDAHCYF